MHRSTISYIQQKLFLHFTHVPGNAFLLISDFHRSRYLLLMGHQNTCDRFHLRPRRHPQCVEFPSVVEQPSNRPGHANTSFTTHRSCFCECWTDKPITLHQMSAYTTSFTTHRHQFWECQTDKPITQCQVSAQFTTAILITQTCVHSVYYSHTHHTDRCPLRLLQPISSHGQVSGREN